MGRKVVYAGMPSITCCQDLQARSTDMWYFAFHWHRRPVRGVCFMGIGEARSVWFSAERQVEIRTEQVRPCGKGEITVEAIASAVSSGTEMTIYRGQAPTADTVLQLPADLIQPQETMGGSFAQRFPIKYAYASVGRVIEAGEGSGFNPGDLVFVRVPHESLYTVRAELAFPLPAWDPIDIGTQMALLDVAVNAILDVPVALGEVVAVYGQGAVGLYTSQLARRTAGKLIVVDPIAKRRDLGIKFGADAAVAPEDALEAIKEISEGRGADLSIEASGAPSALQTAIAGTGVEGTVLIPGYYGLKPVPLTLSPEFHMRRLKMFSSSANALDGRFSQRWNIQRRLQLVADVLPSLHPTEIITHRFPVEQAAQAYQLLDQHPEEVLSIVLTY
jgi:2-desacetyl-2-hydroxyethyl bacteriochlorophyllide A dehydrogenase